MKQKAFVLRMSESQVIDLAKKGQKYNIMDGLDATIENYLAKIEKEIKEN